MVESTGLEIWRSEEATLTELSGLGIWVIGATFWKDRVYTKKEDLKEIQIHSQLEIYVEYSDWNFS